ncbi:MAG TPA: hypothetical protein VLV89_06310 [Candidatus Acidoferrum sp.]|nr:hypothetical protein [Candidatus Acidoferrum sp.]
MRKAKATAAVIVAAVCFFTGIIAAASDSGSTARQDPASQAQQRRFIKEIVLPPQLEAEKPATLAVLDTEGHLLPGVTVDLPEGRHVITDSTGRARFVVTSAPGRFAADISIGSGSIGAVIATADVIVGFSASSTDITISQLPRFAELGGRIEVRGAGFRGDADMNKVFIAGQPSLVLAASPVSLVVTPGLNAVPGDAVLEIGVGARRTKPAVVTLVSLTVDPQAIPIVEGKKNQLVISVRGTEQKLMLAIENRTPDVIQLTGGDIQLVKSTGGRRNRAVIDMRALRATDFSVSVKLAPGGP